MLKKILLLLLAVFITTNVFSQRRFDKWWDEVEELERADLSFDAYEKAQTILKKANRKENAEQFIRAFLYVQKFKLLLKDNSKEEVYEDFLAEIDEQPFPIKNILSSYLAESLKQHYNINQYKINRRTKTDTTSSSFKTWDSETFKEKINYYYELSLGSKEKLVTIPLSDYKNTLSYGDNYNRFRSSLLDLLVLRYLKALQLPKYYTPSRNDFIIDNPLYFSLPSTYSNITLKTEYKHHARHKTLQLYQDLTKLHLQQSDELSALILTLDRYHFLLNNGNYDDNQQEYLNALKKLLSSTSVKEEKAWVAYKLALFYYQNANKNTNYDYSEKALHQVEYVLSLKSNSIPEREALKLKQKISSTSFNVTLQESVIPNQPILTQIEAENIDTLHLSIYQINNRDYDYKVRYRILDTLIPEKKAVHYQKFALKNPDPFYSYSHEFFIDKLPAGLYVFRFSKEKKPYLGKDEHIYSFVHATNLSYYKYDYDSEQHLYVTHKKTGLPISNVDVKVENNGNYTTNEEGLAIIKGKNKSYSEKTLLINGRDTLATGVRFSKKYIRNYEDDGEIKVAIFTDRSIYRPGQIIYFKSILSYQKEEEREVVPFQQVLVSLYNPNNDLVKEIELTTNEFGSVTGEFIIPENNLNGNYQIYIDEDFDRDSDYYNIDFDDAYKRISVEEYKRPTFEVELSNLDSTYVVNDSISVKGKATAFFGGNITNAKVNYKVERSLDYNPILRATSNTINIRTESTKIASGIVNTNNKGDFIIPFKAIPDSLITRKYKPSFTYVITASITDINGETQTIRKIYNFGYHASNLELITNSKIHLNNEQTLTLKTKDLNAKPINASGKLFVYKYKTPNRIIVERPWDTPDIQNVPKSDFLQYYPYFAYDSLDVSSNWEKELMKTISLEIDGQKQLYYQEWKDDLASGEYQILFKGVDFLGDSITAKKEIQFFNKKDEELLRTSSFVTFSSEVKKQKKKNLVMLNLYTPLDNLTLLIDIGFLGKVQFRKFITLKNGVNNIPIEIPKEAEYVNYRYMYISEGVANEQRGTIDIPREKKEEKTLQFEVLTFKNKLDPGKEEVWEFKIIDNKNKPAEAEILASMYDASLDQFKEHDWIEKLHKNRNHINYTRLPYVDNDYDYLEEARFTRRNHTYGRNYILDQFRYTRFKSFGYHFTHTDSYQAYYIKSLIHKNNTKENVVSGTITDKQGLPLPGVNIIIKGTSRGTQTDFDGYYEIKFKEDLTLIFSYLGFETQAILLNKPQELNIVMQDGNSLDAIVVSALGVKRKKDQITSSYQIVDSEALLNTNNPDIISDLAGKISGLQIESDDSGENKIVLRGNRSVSGSKEVLIIIDGKVATVEQFGFLNSNQLASVDMIKGSNGAAMYGSQGANGVIVVTTKNAVKDLQQIKARTNLQETAFFFPQLKTNKKGEVSFQFKSPEALTRWKFQAFAHDKNLHQAKLDLSTITQKELNILPNFPRFFRSKDSIIISAKVNNLSDKTLNGIIQLEFTDELTQKIIELILDAASVKNFNIPSKGNTEVNWKLAIPEGLEAVRYRIVAKAGNFSDGEENIIPVFTNRIFITEALPIWLNPNEEKTFSLENLKNNTSPALKNHQLIFEYTSNPVWTAIKALPYLVEYPYECAEQTFARYYANNLASHLLKQNPEIENILKDWKKKGGPTSDLNKNAELKNILIQETPWLKTAQSQEKQQQRLALLLDAKKSTQRAEDNLDKLALMQMSSGAFPWFTGGRENLSISLHILTSMERLQNLNKELSTNKKYQKIKDKLISYLDDKLIQNKSDENYYASLQLNFLYARSFNFSNENENLNNFSKEVLNSYQDKWVSLSIQSQLTLALTAYRFDQKELSKNILEALKQNAVINSKYGMYWKELTKSYAWFNDAIATQALAIEAYHEIENDTKSVQQLKTWLLRNKKTESWKSTKATTEAIYALLSYNKNNASAEFPTIKIGDKKINPTPTETETGYYRTSFSTKEIEPEMSQIEIKNNSETAQYGGLYWQYFEESDKVKDSQQEQISISKELFKKVETDEGSTLKSVTKESLALGDVIVVRLVINAKESFSFMHLKDMRASGLEPIDVISKYKYQDGLAFYQSTKDVATHFFFDNLRKGTYVLEYNLKVNNKGDFSNGITQLQSMYAPEFKTQTKGTRLKVN